jgi:SagB-type dehydrogenase family enzyme
VPSPRTSILWLVFSLLLLVPAPAAGKAGLKTTPLPKPQMEGGRPLMQVLKARASSRSFRPDKLPMQTLSNLLWAAFGINRPDGRRTAPSAMNWQEIDVYVVMAEGAYRYDAKANSLLPVAQGDLRPSTGKQPFVKDAPIGLVYVADLSRASKGSDEDKAIYTAADTGFIAQNVYLFCASEGLASVVRGSVDREALGKALKLRTDQKIVLAQTVGLPGKVR